jgi:hypothetical protein
MPVLPAEADIRCPAEKIFDVITDFGGQDRWLARSSAFRGTTAISPGPVTLGTTYVEPGPAAGVTHVTRVVTMTVPRRLRLIQPVLVRAFRAESTRTLMALKAHADALA